MRNERTVDLNVRGKDEFSGTLGKLEKAQQRIIEQNRKIAQSPPGDLRKFYQDTQREIDATQAKIGGLAQEFRKLAAAEGDNRQSIAALVLEKAKLQVKAGELRASLEGVRQAHHQLRTAQQGGFSAFNATATAMEKEAAAARNLAAARAAANERLRGLINERLSNPARSGFGNFARETETRVIAEANARAIEAEAAAQRKAAAEAQRKIEIQQRLNQVSRSGFAEWSRYADTISRLAAQEERSAAIAQRKAAIRARLNSQAVSGYRAWSQSARGMRDEAAAAASAAAQLNKVEQASRKAATAQGALAQQAGNANAAMRGRRRGDSGGRKGEAQDVELYGLKPYQMVNLGYQVNDVISGFAMGQAPLQILAQQAGQFAQIWPNVMVGLVRSLPQIAAVTAALAPFAAAANKLRKEAESLKYFSAQLNLLADGSRYSATALTKLTGDLERAGVKLDSARKAVVALVKEGFSEAQIRDISEMARQLSKVTGEDFESEVRRLGEAFSGSAFTVRELDRELQFLTAAQLEHIYGLERAGKRTQALQYAQDALKNSLDSSRQQLTPWQQALKNLGDAWRNLVDIIANSKLFQDFLRDLRQLAEDFERITRGINTASQWMRAATGNITPQERYQINLQRRSALESQLPSNVRDDNFLPTFETAALYEEWVKINREIYEYERGQRQAAAATAATGAAAQVVKQLSEEERKNREDLQYLLDDMLIKMREEAAQASMTARQQFIQNKLLDARNEAMEKGLKLSREQVEAIRAQAGALYDAQNSVVATGNYGSIVDRIVGVESGGDAGAKNPLSTATGLGQFIESTWLEMFKKYFPDRAASMSKEAILALRKDSALSRKMIELYAQENAKILQQAGVAVNDAAVYLAHFLGPKGAIATLRAAPGTTTDQFLGQDQINANASILRGKTAGEVVAWAEQKMQLTDAEVEASQRLITLDEERAKKQADYIKDYQKRVADQQFELEMARKTAREAAIQKALRDEELKAQEAGVELTKEQRDLTARLAAEQFDRANAELRVNELLERRTQLAQSLQIAQQAGDSGKVQEIVEKIRGTEEELRAAIDAAIAFYQVLGGPAADAAIQKLQNLKDTVGDTLKDLETRFLPTAEELNERLADVGGDAFSAFAEAIARGENAVQSFFAALRQGIGEFLIEIGKAIVKQALFNAISGGASGGGVGGAVAGWVGGLFGARHVGGMVGSASPTRMVDPSVFANAQRYHTGGLVGRERPIIALEDEEVLTRDDPRHVLNGGKRGGDPRLKVVNVLDGAEVLQHALASEIGERTFLNWMSRNSTAINAALSS